MELEAVMGALVEGDQRLLSDWARTTSARLRGTAQKIAARHGLVLRPDELEDAESVALASAWKALAGYRYFCPVCRVPDSRFGEKLHRAFDTRRGLEQHARRAHGESLDPPSIDRRVWYMIGSSMQRFAKQVQRRRQQERLAVEIEGLDDAHRERVLADVSRPGCGIGAAEIAHMRASLGEISDPVQRGRAAGLLSGWSVEEVMDRVRYG